MHNWPGDLMHYAIYVCNIHPFPPYPELGITKSNALWRFMHYNNMHYENFNCTSIDVHHFFFAKKERKKAVLLLRCKFRIHMFLGRRDGMQLVTWKHPPLPARRSFSSFSFLFLLIFRSWSSVQVSYISELRGHYFRAPGQSLGERWNEQYVR